MCAMAAVAMLSVSSCLSEEEVNFTRGQEKGEGYGYIRLNATTEDAVVTRGSFSGDNLYTWYAKVYRTVGNDTEYGWSDTENSNDFKFISSSFATTPFANATWTVDVCNYKTLADALAANSNYGAAKYSGSASVPVTAGSTAEPTIACGTPDNTQVRLNVSNTTFKGTALIVTFEAGGSRGDLACEWNGSTSFDHSEVFFGPTATVNYYLTYTINGAEKRWPVTGTHEMTMGAAGTYKTLSVTSNTNGTITLTITTSDFENDEEPEEIVFDAATGAKV